MTLPYISNLFREYIEDCDDGIVVFFSLTHFISIICASFFVKTASIFCLGFVASLLWAGSFTYWTRNRFERIRTLQNRISDFIHRNRSNVFFCKPIIFAFAFLVILSSYLLAGKGIVPPEFKQSGDYVLRWGHHDKRCFVLLYVLSLLGPVFIKYAAGVFVAPGISQPAVSLSAGMGSEAGLSGLLFPSSNWSRLFWLIVGGYLGFSLLGIPLWDVPVRHDLHMDVHLSPLLAIKQGMIPYIEARTQYGPGNQALLNYLMNKIDFSYLGAFKGQIIINIAAISLFFAMLFWFAGPLVGVSALVLFPLLPSPHNVAAYPGWGLLSRWLGVALIGFWMSEVLFARTARKGWLVALVGVFWGVGAFVSQENLSGGLLVTILVFGFAGGTGRISFLQSVQLFGTFIVSGVVTFLSLAISLGSVESLTYFVDAYFRGPRLVRDGISNMDWSSAAYPDWLLYRVTIVLFPMLVAALALFERKIDSDALRQRHKILVGVLCGAAVLCTFTLFRADPTHLRGPSFLLVAAVICGVALFPSVVTWPRRYKAGLVMFLLGLIVVSIVPSGTKPLRTLRFDILYPPKLLGLIEEVGSDIDEMSSGYRASSNAQGTARILARLAAREVDRGLIKFKSEEYISDMIDLLTAIQVRVKAGPLVVTEGFKTNSVGLMPSAGYFYGDFEVATTVSEPMTTIWLGSEQEGWIEEIKRREPACIVSPRRDWESDPVMKAWVEGVDRNQLDFMEIKGRIHYGTAVCQRTR